MNYTDFKLKTNLRWMWGVMLSLFVLSSDLHSEYIQIKGEPGILVFLNDTFVSKTTEEMGGCVISGVSPGENVLKLVKEGYGPQVTKVQVRAGDVYLYKVKSFTPSVKVKQSGSSSNATQSKVTGSLTVQTIPIDAKISIKSLGILDSAKKEDKWIIEKMPVGKHEITVSGLGKEVTYEVKVRDGIGHFLRFNMIEGRLVFASPVPPVISQNAVTRTEDGGYSGYLILHKPFNHVLIDVANNEMWACTTYDIYNNSFDEPTDADFRNSMTLAREHLKRNGIYDASLGYKDWDFPKEQDSAKNLIELMKRYPILQNGFKPDVGSYIDMSLRGGVVTLERNDNGNYYVARLEDERWEHAAYPRSYLFQFEYVLYRKCKQSDWDYLLE